MLTKRSNVLTLFSSGLLLFSTWGSVALQASVTSTSGNIHFDVNDDATMEMTFDASGLGIGANLNPGANLHVEGNTLITGTLSIGSSTASTSNLNLTGTLSHGVGMANGPADLGGNSIVLADSSSGNFTLNLPVASSVEGRIYQIKKTTPSYDVVVAGGNIDNGKKVRLGSGNLGMVELISSSGNWHILDGYSYRVLEITLLASYFNSVNKAGAGPDPIATGINWDTVYAVDTPSSSLTFYGADGFHDVTANEIDVDRNLATESSWSTNLAITIPATTQSVDLTSLEFNWRVNNNSGADGNSASKTTTWTANLIASVNGLLGSTSHSGAPGNPNQKRTLDLSGNTLNSSETYTLILIASGTGFGHNASLKDLTLAGNVFLAP